MKKLKPSENFMRKKCKEKIELEYSVEDNMLWGYVKRKNGEGNLSEFFFFNLSFEQKNHLLVTWRNTEIFFKNNYF